MFGPHSFIKLVETLNHSEIFLFSVQFSLDPWPTKLSVQSIPGALSLRSKRPGRKA
jgi:hypothetical protein